VGMRSSFVDEEEIYIKDKELKEFCEKYKDDEESFNQQPILEWYKTHDTFSFEMCDDWKIQSYWYDGFMKMLKVIELFIDEGKQEEGFAKFEYEEGQPFVFRIDYDTKKLVINYVPPVWETMENKIKFESKLLKEDVQKLTFLKEL